MGHLVKENVGHLEKEVEHLVKENGGHLVKENASKSGTLEKSGTLG